MATTTVPLGTPLHGASADVPRNPRCIKSQSERLYLDLFGGQPLNRERLTDADLDGSARIALLAEPAVSRLRFFEQEPFASRLRASLAADFPGRRFEVVPGDCNQTIGTVLDGLLGVNWAPTFAFIDPNGPDIHWSTLEALAHFRKQGLSEVELWILVAAGTFIRNLRTDGTVPQAEADKLTRMYGTEQWRGIYEARLSGAIAPSDAREEYVNLMRWRLEKVLGYRWTHPLEIFNEQGASIYHMVFATDHEAGSRIMTSLYNAAANEFPAMRKIARQRRARLDEESRGVFNLFGEQREVSTAAVPPNEKLYVHSPPWTPCGAADVG